MKGYYQKPFKVDSVLLHNTNPANFAGKDNEVYQNDNILNHMKKMWQKTK